jgi:hypothetical protein
VFGVTTETGNKKPDTINLPYFEYRISNKEFRIMKFSFPSTSPPPADSVFCGSLFSDLPPAQHPAPEAENGSDLGGRLI